MDGVTDVVMVEDAVILPLADPDALMLALLLGLPVLLTLAVTDGDTDGGATTTTVMVLLVVLRFLSSVTRTPTQYVPSVWKT